MAINSSNIANLLKKLYPTDVEARFMIAKSPLLGIIEKKTTDGSDGGTSIPTIYGDYAGRSADFSESKTAMSSGFIPSENFTLTIPENFANMEIGQRQIKATQNNRAAFLKILQEVTESGMRVMSKDIAYDLFRDGTGVMGVISGVAGQVITFTSRKGLRKIDIGTRLNCYSDTGFGTQRANTATVTHIDRAAGKITVTGTISAWVTADVVTVAGDAGAKIKGISAWIPAVAPTSGDNFFGVDRSKDAVALAGVRYNAGSQMLKDALIDAASEIVDLADSDADVCVLSPKKFAEIAKETSDRSTVWGTYGSIKIGYSAIQIAGPKGMINVLVDANCPDDRAYILDTSSWKFVCLGENKLFSTWNDDSLDFIRSASNNSIEMRLYSYSQLACYNPSKNAVILFDN